MTTTDTAPAPTRRDRVLAAIAEGKLSLTEIAQAEGVSKQAVSAIARAAGHRNHRVRGRPPGTRTGVLPPRADLPTPAEMLAEELEAIQRELHLRRKDYAAALGAKRGTIDNYTTGRRRYPVTPVVARCARLLRHLHRRGFDVPRLIRESEEEKT